MATADPVEQVKARLRAVADQIKELSRSEGPPETFFKPFLQLLCSALHAHGGVVWYVEGDRLRPAHAVGGENLAAVDQPEVAQLNLKLVTDSLVTEQTAAYHNSSEVGLPEDFTLLVIPVKANGQPVAAVEVFQRGNITPAAREGYAQFVERMCVHATAFLEAKTASESVMKDDGFWSEFETAILDMNRLLDVKHVCGVGANDGKKLLGVQRVSVAYKKGRRTDVLASSGVDEVQKRADQTRSLGKLAAEAIRFGQPIVFTGTIDQFSKKMGQLLDTHVRLSNARYVMLVPLYANDRRRIDVDPTSQEARNEVKRKPIGCLIAEQLSDGNPPADVEKRAHLLADHLSAALSNSRTFSQIPMFSTLRAAGALRDWFHGRKLMKLLLFLGAVTAVVAALTFVPWEYRVKADGKLMPVAQTRVYAPVEGEVAEIKVDSGANVSAGDELIVLENPEIRAEIVGIKAQIREKEELIVQLDNQAAIANRDRDSKEVARIGVQMTETEVQIEGLRSQLEILLGREQRLIIKAPVDGVVATFQIEELLSGRPVNRGEMLLEIMQPTGRWRLEVQVPEHRMGHIRRGMEVKETAELPATYVLATATEQSYPGTLSEVATRADVSSEAGTNVFEVYLNLDQEDRPAELNIGSEVTAKIECGKRSLGYVLFGDVVEFIQRQLWW